MGECFYEPIAAGFLVVGFEPTAFDFSTMALIGTRQVALLPVPAFRSTARSSPLRIQFLTVAGFTFSSLATALTFSSSSTYG